MSAWELVQEWTFRYMGKKEGSVYHHNIPGSLHYITFINPMIFRSMSTYCKIKLI